MKILIRFFLLLMPRWATGRCTAGRAAWYAIELAASGHRRLADWCWARAVELGAHDESTCDVILDLCMRAGQTSAAEAYANAFFDASGLSPAIAARFAGSLVLVGEFGTASRIFERLETHCNGNAMSYSPAPAWRPPSAGECLGAMLQTRSDHSIATPSDDTGLYLDMARLCFVFSAFDVSAALFDRTGDCPGRQPEDRIAHWYCLIRLGQQPDIPGSVLRDIESVSADWQTLLATVFFVTGLRDEAAATIERAMRARFERHPELEAIVTDCRSMVDSISRCPLLRQIGDGGPDVAAGDGPGVRKLFVCGNGWSGSGALYDALMEYDDISEAPSTPEDPYINACTGQEMMFVQGVAGLGRIWREAREKSRVLRYDLWELFRCHVTGGGGVGHSEHKGARTAESLLNSWGSRYTTIFRRTFQAIERLPEGASRPAFRRVLATATEAIAGEISRGSSGACVVFDNAMFGRNIDMIEIFDNWRAAVVVRDPLDQYADRRSRDLKHWMTPDRFVSFYRRNTEEFRSGTGKLPGNLASAIREVQFERFVLDETYRRGVIGWMLEGLSMRPVRRRFEPDRSANNVGIHAHLLVADERDAIESGLEHWPRI